MKPLSRISKKGIIAVSAVLIVMAGALVLGTPSIFSMDMGGGGCCGGDEPGTTSSWVNIPILNNHYPTTATISKIYFVAPEECYEGMMHKWYNVKKVSQIRFGDTTVFDPETGNCCCLGTTNHSAGRTYTLDTSHAFSTTKVTCKVGLDAAAPTGSYTIKFYYRLPGDTADRENTQTFTLPS